MRRFVHLGSWLLVCVMTAGLLIETAQAAGTAALQSNGGQQRPGQGRPGGGNQGQRPPQGGNRPGKPGGPQTRPTPQPARPTPQPTRPQPSRPQPNRPPAHRPPPRPVNRPRPHYNFGDGGNGWRLRQFFNGDMARINRGRRPHCLPGHYFPHQYVTYLQPIPPNLITYLPPVPPGYAIGYYDGYTVVYDPATFLIISVLDLFRY